MIKLTEEEFNNLFMECKQVTKADNGTHLCPMIAYNTRGNCVWNKIKTRN